MVSCPDTGDLNNELNDKLPVVSRGKEALLSSVPVPLPAHLSRGAGHARRTPAVRLFPGPTGAARAGTLFRFLLEPQGLRPDVACAAHLISVYGMTIRTRVRRSGSQKGPPPCAA